MYAESVYNGRVSLGRALHSLQSVVLIEGLLDNLGRSMREKLVFMNIRAETSTGNTDVVAVMRDSYASYLVSGFERIVLIKRGEKTAKNVRQALRYFNNLFNSSVLGSENRVHLHQRVREHLGIPLFGRVFVAGRNGYAVISPNQAAIAEIETAPWDARATTIEKVVARIVNEEQLELDAAFSFQYQ